MINADNIYCPNKWTILSLAGKVIKRPALKPTSLLCEVTWASRQPQNHTATLVSSSFYWQVWIFQTILLCDQITPYCLHTPTAPDCHYTRAADCQLDGSATFNGLLCHQHRTATTPKLQIASWMGQPHI